MSIFILRAAAAAAAVVAGSASAAVSPIVAAYGDVFPVMSEQSLSVFRTSDPGPWFTTFNLLATAAVSLGVDELPSESNGGANGIRGSFHVTSIRIVTIDGANVAFGTDTFVNPFPSHIVALASVASLPAGLYALAVSGVGDRSTCTPYCADAPDFVTRLRVMPASPVPEPAALPMLLAGLAVMGCLARRRGLA